MNRQRVPGGIHVGIGLVGLTGALLLVPVRSGGELPASEPPSHAPSKAPGPPAAVHPAGTTGAAKKDDPAPAPQDTPKADARHTATHAAPGRPGTRRAGGR